MKKFYYSSGEEVKVGDIIRVWKGSAYDERFVGIIMQPGSRESADSGCPNGGVVIVDMKNNWLVEHPDSGTLNEEYKLFRRKNDKFYYFSGQEVEVGDIIRAWDGSKWIEGFVEEILKARSEQAKDWDFPEGGVLIKDPHHGRVLEHPDSGFLDADFEFVRRRNNGGIERKNETNN